MALNTIWSNIILICQKHPEILIFLSLAIGYYVGKIKVFGFSLGSTTSVLLAAIILGQIDVSVTPLIKTVSFSFFLFAVGYKVGPQFVSSFKKNGIPYIILSIFFAIVGLVTAIILGKLFVFDQGTTAGLLSGSMTQSSIIGAAKNAIKSLSIPSAQKTILISNIAIAHSITYMFGFAGIIIFYKIIPRLLKLNLKKEAQQLESKLIETKNKKKKIKQKTKTSIAMVGIGCALGTAIGLAGIKIGTIPLTLGIGGGTILSGLFFGWLGYGYISDENQWLLTDLGLNLFIACVGLTAAPMAIQSLQTKGLSLFFAGIILALTPHILGIIFGRIVLKLDYILLLGALTGAGTITPSLNVLKEEANSSTPALGYAIPYSLSNLILTILGMVIVHFM